MKKIFTFLVVLVSTLSVFAADFKSGDLWYTITSSTAPYTVEVASHTDHESLVSVDIPALVKNGGVEYAVTNVAAGALKTKTLTSVRVGQNVIKFSKDAFYGESGGLERETYLKSVYWNVGSGSAMKWEEQSYLYDEYNGWYIPDEVYYGPFGRTCKSITSFTIGKSVLAVPNYLCRGMKNLTSITIEATTPPTLPSEVFTDSKVDTAYIPTGTMAQYVGSNWRNYITYFVEKDMGGSVDPTWQITYTSTDGLKVNPNDPTVFGGANIVSNTYAGGVGTITFDAPVTTIGNWAFQKCSTLLSITIPSSVTSLGFGPFEKCSALESIVIPDGVASMGNYVFDGCAALSSVTLSKNVAKIGSNTFYGCSSLTSITIPSGVNSIGLDAFGECSALATVTVKATTPPSLGGGAFWSSPTCNIPCGTLAAYQASDWASWVGSFVDPCPATPGSVITYTSIDGLKVTPNDPTAFGGANIISNTYADGVGTITFDATLTEIGDDAFAECHTLSSVVLPAGVTELGSNAFEVCENLVSVSLPDGLKTIGMNAFLSCDHLSSIVIPNSVTSIGINSFNGCMALKSVVLSENLGIIEAGLFNGCEALDYIVIPSSVTDIAKNAFYGCVGLDSIKCMSITPAKLANKKNVFNGMEKTIPVYVPCIAGGVSSVAAYKAAWGDYFTNFQEPRPIYSVALSVNDNAMGTAKIGARNTECGVEVVAVPSTGYEFVEWSNGNKNDTLLLVLEADSAMKAIFKPKRYTITAVSADPARGTAQGAEGDYNTEVKISATSKFGYRFDYWHDGGQGYQDNPRQVLVKDTATYVAYFKEALEKVNKTVSVCDNTNYVDPITGATHAIASATPASLIWNDSVWTALDKKDTLYTFVVTPLVAPKLLERADLEDLPGAVPVLVPGYEPDTTASVAAIWNYYKANDDEKTADVVSVKWNYSGKVKCDDTTFAMALTVTDTCGNELITACDFVVKPNIVADTIVEESCGEYTWGVTGLTYDKTGIYADTVKSKALCDSVYHVLDLKVWGPDTTVINDTVCYGAVVNGEKLTEDKLIEEPSGKTIHGCDSMTVYKFTVLPVIPVDTTKVTICAGESYTWEEGDGKTYTTKQSIFVNKPTAKGCDSILALELTVLPQLPDSFIRDTLCYGKTYTWTKVGKKYTGAGELIKDSSTYEVDGCLGKLYLELTCWPEVVNVVTDTTICCGDSIKWNGRMYKEEGIYNLDTVSMYGCDSLATLDLKVLSKIKPTIIDTTICHGDYYYWDLTEQEYKETTRDTVVLEHGIHKCDSMVVLNLTVLDALDTTWVDAYICPGDSLEFDGKFYSSKAENITVTKSSVLTGCDSIVVFNLYVRPANEVLVDTVTRCYGGTYTWPVNGKDYKSSVRDTVEFKDMHGCDSIHVLDLTIYDKIDTLVVDTTLCYGDTLVWVENDNKKYFETQVVEHKFTSIHGCDSVVRMNLTVLPKIDTTFVYDTICEGYNYKWYDEVYTTTGQHTYIDQSASGCDSVVILDLYAHPVIPDTVVNDTICYGETYVFADTTLTTKADITHTFTSVNGCDSVVTLKLHVLDSIPVTYETAYLCYGKPYFWEVNNENYYVATTDTAVLLDVHGCDSLVVLNLIEVPELKSKIDTTICYGDTIEWNGQLLGESQTIVTRLQSAISGCDSVVTLNLTVLDPIKPVVTEDTICACKAPYIWRNQPLRESGVYHDTVKTKYGCDSIYTLKLHVWPEIKDTTVKDTICYGDFYVFGGDTLKGNSDLTKTLPSVNGCDSTVHLQLTVLESIPVTYETAYICFGKEPYFWEAKNQTYYSATTDTVVLSSVVTGCDSTVVLTVIAVEEMKSTVTDTICFGDSIEWGGNYYKKNGQYDMHLQSEISGCDSVVTLHLTVLDKIEPVVTEDTICACKAPYIWRNKALRETGVYNDTVVTEHGCDSIYTLKLHVWPLIKDTIVNETICYGDFYVFGGDTLVEEVTNKAHKFTSINGCDSIVTLNLTILEAIPVTYETAYICYGKEPYYWEAKNKNYYSAITDTVVLPSILTGCDSMVVLTIKEVEELKSTVDTTICFGDSIEWGGNYYKKNGQYDMTLQSVISGCDSVVTLNLTIRPMIEPTYTPDTICSGDAYIWHGQTYNATGEYSFTHTSIHGCDSVEILQLFVRPVVETVTKAEICSGEVYRWEGENYTSSTNKSITYTSKITGCDSIVTLHLIVHDEIPVTVLDTAICHGTSINWLGTSYANDTIVTDTLICKHGCDSIVMLKLHIRDSIHTVVYDTICHDGTYEWNDRIYTDTITDQITLTDIYGCDSIVTLHLTVLDPILPTEDTQVACDSYEWHGDIYTASGDYTKTLTTRHGCDSVVTLHLTVKYSSYTDTTAVECDSFYWHNTGETYTESGDYTYTTVAANGCDSIVTLHLTIKKSTVGEAEQLIICFGDSIEWNGQVYKVEGDYSTILENANAVGCDSTAKMHLTILPDVQYEYYKATICANETYEWFNRQLSKAGTHYDTVYNILACDSIIHVLDLTVLPIDTIRKTVTACDSYTWNGETYTVSGEYPYTTPSLVDGCDSVTILVLTITPTIYKDTTVAACISYEWNGFVYKQSGDYTNTFTAASGCDSIVTLHLTINQPTEGDPRKEYICDGESYEWHGTTYSESGYYSIILENAVGCDSTAYLDLVVLPETKYESHTLYVCASELPYEWKNLSLTESGEYTYREQFAANASCDSIEYVLTLIVYDMSLPDTISQPIAICGKPIDLMKATDQIESYIASISHYAPNATVVWQEWIDGVWVDYDYETLKGSQSEIIIRYAIITDCGVIYSDEMVFVVEQATPENSTELDNMSVESKYGNRIFLFDLNAFSSTFGWTPTPEQVYWYKVVGEVDVYGEMGDDELVGVGHSYNLPEGEVMVGGYYAIVEQHAVSVDDCETIYRSTVVYATASGIAPKLVPNVVYPDEVLTIKNLDESQIHQILVYGASGELIATYKADKVGEFMFNAANATGYYLVDIINTNGSTTLRYVVK